MSMTQQQREMHILGVTSQNPNDLLNLVSGWNNEDGSITLVQNCRLARGTRIVLRRNGSGTPASAPHWSFSVLRSKTHLTEDHEIEILA